MAKPTGHKPSKALSSWMQQNLRNVYRPYAMERLGLSPKNKRDVERFRKMQRQPEDVRLSRYEVQNLNRIKRAWTHVQKSEFSREVFEETKDKKDMLRLLEQPEPRARQKQGMLKTKLGKLWGKDKMAENNIPEKGGTEGFLRFFFGKR